MGNAILQDLKNDQSTLSTVLNSMNDAVYVVDRSRRIIFWNRAAETVTGYLADDVMGRCCSDDILNHIDEDGHLLCRGKCPLETTMETGVECSAKVYPLHKQGRRFPTMTRIGALRDEAGTVVAGIEIFRDISSEEEFRLLQEKFNALIKKYVSNATLEGVLSQLQHGTGHGQHSVMRDLTVLYMDIVGFTAFSESHDPGQVTGMLNDLFAICQVLTTECHGDIDKFIGDAIMAVFVDANDAVEAGKKILRAIPDFNDIRESEHEEKIRVRIGINSGQVMQGEIGTPERKDLTVIGDVVNTASRIESITEPLNMCISEATLARLKTVDNFVPFKTVHVKNREEPVTIYCWKQ